jgi:proteic killer suppression protein
MIKSFADKETQRLYERQYSRRLPHLMQRLAMRKLWLIDAAISLHDLKIPPSNHLEKLSGQRKGQYSIRINKQWRICFQWRKQDAYEVEIIDYH